MKEINKDNWHAEVIESETPVIIDFWAPWCGPCRMISPVLDAINNEHDDIKVVKVNIDQNPELANKMNVMSIPTLIKFDAGEETHRVIGALPKNRLEAELDL